VSDEASKRNWLTGFLGIDIADEEAGSDVSLLAIWLAAKETVDIGLGRLQAVLREFGDPELDQIAELGLNAVTDKSSVGLMVALRGRHGPRRPGQAGQGDPELSFVSEGKHHRPIDRRQPVRRLAVLEGHARRRARFARPPHCRLTGAPHHGSIAQ